MSESLIFAIPSKGRLKEQVEAWLADCGLKLDAPGGARGYSASLSGAPGVSVRLASAGDIANLLEAGEVHLGVTGEDLVREISPALDGCTRLLRPLGFGRADLVVATPRSWLDVATMADLDAVADAHVARTGRRLRVATKYIAQTRAFFARHGVVDYRIVASGGATEGAPAAGEAELIVDITTTGATLAANGLARLSDGLILKSQAHLAASLAAPWSPQALEAGRNLVALFEARARALTTLQVTWPGAHAMAAAEVCKGFVETLAAHSGVLAPERRMPALCMALAARGVEPLTVSRPTYVFTADPADWARFRDALDE